MADEEQQVFTPKTPDQLDGLASNGSKIKELFDAVSEGNKKKVQKILKDDELSVDCCDSQGMTPLYKAALWGHEGVVSCLLKHGANPNEKSKEGCTPVHGAVYSGNMKVVSKLIEAGGDLRLHDKKGWTVREWAMAQEDGRKRNRMISFLERARLAAMTMNMKDHKKKKQTASRFSPAESFVNMMRKHGFMGSDPEIHIEPCKSVYNMGFGKVLCAGNSEGGAVATIPLVPEKNLKHDEAGFTYNNGPFMVMESMIWKDTYVTVKRLHREPLDGGTTDLLITEAEHMGKLRHPNILLLMGICQTGNLEGMVLLYERVGCGSLFCYLHERMEILSYATICDIMRQLGDALLFIHGHNLLHGCLTSHAVQLTSTYTAKLCNMEYMVENHYPCTKSSVLENQKGYKLSAAHWMAPEVLAGDAPAAESDVYSLSVIMWEMIHGVVPWSMYTADEIKTEMLEHQVTLEIHVTDLPSVLTTLMEYGLQLDHKMRRGLSMTEIRDICIHYLLNCGYIPGITTVHKKTAEERKEPEYVTATDFDASAEESVKDSSYNAIYTGTTEKPEKPVPKKRMAQKTLMETEEGMKKVRYEAPEAGVEVNEKSEEDNPFRSRITQADVEEMVTRSITAEKIVNNRPPAAPRKTINQEVMRKEIVISSASAVTGLDEVDCDPVRDARVPSARRASKQTVITSRREPLNRSSSSAMSALILPCEDNKDAIKPASHRRSLENVGSFTTLPPHSGPEILSGRPTSPWQANSILSSPDSSLNDTYKQIEPEPKFKPDACFDKRRGPSPREYVDQWYGGTGSIRNLIDNFQCHPDQKGGKQVIVEFKNKEIMTEHPFDRVTRSEQIISQVEHEDEMAERARSYDVIEKGTTVTDLRMTRDQHTMPEGADQGGTGETATPSKPEEQEADKDGGPVSEEEGKIRLDIVDASGEGPCSSNKHKRSPSTTVQGYKLSPYRKDHDVDEAVDYLIQQLDEGMGKVGLGTSLQEEMVSPRDQPDAKLAMDEETMPSVEDKTVSTVIETIKGDEAMSEAFDTPDGVMFSKRDGAHMVIHETPLEGTVGPESNINNNMIPVVYEDHTDAVPCQPDSSTDMREDRTNVTGMEPSCQIDPEEFYFDDEIHPDMVKEKHMRLQATMQLDPCTPMAHSTRYYASSDSDEGVTSQQYTTARFFSPSRSNTSQNRWHREEQSFSDGEAWHRKKTTRTAREFVSKTYKLQHFHSASGGEGILEEEGCISDTTSSRKPDLDSFFEACGVHSLKAPATGSSRISKDSTYTIPEEQEHGGSSGSELSESEYEERQTFGYSGDSEGFTDSDAKAYAEAVRQAAPQTLHVEAEEGYRTSVKIKSCGDHGGQHQVTAARTDLTTGETHAKSRVVRGSKLISKVTIV